MGTGDAECASLCTDYLTEGVVVRRKWLGLVGIGGLIPRDGVCAGELSTLKVFINCATLPRPAQGVVFPDDPASSELAF